MKILGINFGEYNASAALCENGEILGGAGEERFTREKKTKAFPYQAVNFLLDQQELSFTSIDAIAQAWNPGASWIAFNPLLSKNRIKREDYFYTLPDHLYNLTDRAPSDWVKLETAGGLPPIYFVQHHRAHSANAFFLSNFDEAAFLTADFQGELECITRGIGRNNELTILDTQLMPHSIGMFYATYTQMVGYRPDNDEWKVMALAAEDVDPRGYYEKIRGTINLLPNGRFELDQSYYKGAIVTQPNLYTEKLADLLDMELISSSQKSKYEWVCKISKAMQLVAEDIVWHVLKDLYEKTKLDNLVVSGGFFMNSVLNGKIISKTDFKRVYISHSPDDLGNSIGSALYVHHCILGHQRTPTKNNSNIGPSYNDSDIEAALKRRKIPFEALENPESRVAALLAEGNVVAVHQGRMEFGDRALGFRSILGDPRSAETKSIINSMIKYREDYRPFAPATTIDHASVIFDVTPDYRCPYMEKVVPVRESWQDRIPAVTHFDGSARMQTVEKETNPYFYNVIERFGEITGVPVVLNTSFNINGEPIVMSPDDAISTFFNSGLEYLMLNRFLIKK